MRTCLIGLLSLVLSSQVAWCHEWADVTGQHRLEADFVDVTAGKVQLKTSDNRHFSIDMQQLRSADRQFALEQKMPEMKTVAMQGAAPATAPSPFQPAPGATTAAGNLPAPAAQSQTTAPASFKRIFCGCQSTFHIIGNGGTLAYWGYTPIIGWHHSLVPITNVWLFAPDWIIVQTPGNYWLLRDIDCTPVYFWKSGGGWQYYDCDCREIPR